MSELSKESGNRKWFEEDTGMDSTPEIGQSLTSSHQETSQNIYSDMNESKFSASDEIYENKPLPPKRDYIDEETLDNSTVNVKTEVEKEDSDENFVSRLREKLRKIFVFYASFGSRCNSKYLKPSQFIKMMIDADIADDHLSQRKLDLIFLKACQKSRLLKFDNFLELLFIIAQRKFRKEEAEPNAKFKALLVEFMEPLFETIYNETDMGLEDQIFNSPITLSTLLIMKMISKPLAVIYKHHFKWEVKRPLNEKPSRNKLETELFKFLRDFEICPQMMSKSVSHSLLTETLAMKKSKLTMNDEYSDLAKIFGPDFGENFSFFRFIVFLARLGIYIFSDLNNIPANQKETEFTSEEKVYLLLERMDISAGLSKIYHLLGKNHNKNQTLTIDKLALKHIHEETKSYPNFFRKVKEVKSLFPMNKKDEPKSGKGEFMYMKLARGKKLKTKHSFRNKSKRRKKSKNNISINNHKDKENISGANNISRGHQNLEGPDFVLPESYDIFEKYLEELHKIFECYCSFGEPSNYSLMSSGKFLKLLRDTGLTLEENEHEDFIPHGEAEIIFHEICHGMNPLITKSRKKNCFVSKAFGRMEQNSSTSNYNSGSSQNSKISRSKSSKMDFAKFLQSIEVIALISSSSQTNASKLLSLIENRFLSLAMNRLNNNNIAIVDNGVQAKLEKSEYFTFKLVSLLKDKTMIQMLGAVHKAILPLYIFYSDAYKCINQKNYKKFMKDFGVFPELISNSKLSQLFHELQTLFKSKPEAENSKKVKEVIDEHLFIEGLAIIATEIEYPKFKLNNAQKMILLLERMNDSDGAKKISRELGRTISEKFDIVSQIRNKFSEFFKI